jgi:3-phenylpropionate/trans-cinnamate dioxygenase ferredoxin reductase subunit
MVDAIKSIAARIGATCYADPFLPTTDDTVDKSVLTRAMRWLAVPTSRQTVESEQPMQPRGMADAKVRSHYRPQSA